MLRLLRRRNFTLLWLGGLISMLGDWMLFVAVPVSVFRLSGSALATGFALIARFAPRFLLSSPAGVLVDRWDRRRTLVVANLALAASILPLIAVRSSEWLWLVYAAVLAESLVSPFLVAERALLPRLVPAEDLIEANALNSLNQNVSRLVGPAVGGLLFAATGLQGVAVVDALSYVVAAAMTALVVLPAGTGSSGQDAGPAQLVTGAWSAMRHEWLAGLDVMRRDQVIYGILAVFALSATAEGLLAPLFVVFGTTVVHGGAQGFGWLLSAQAIGGIGGGLIAGRFGRRMPATGLVATGMLLLGVIDLVIWNVHVLWIDMILMAIVGVPVAAYSAGYVTLIQTRVADEFRGRVFGMLETIVAPLIVVGTVLAGALAPIVGVVPMLNVSACFDVGGGIAAFALLTGLGRRRARDVTGDRDSPVMSRSS